MKGKTAGGEGVLCRGGERSSSAAGIPAGELKNDGADDLRMPVGLVSALRMPAGLGSVALGSQVR